MIFFVALRKELLEQWRTYRMLIVGAVLLAFGLTSPLIARLTPELVRLMPNGDQIAALVPAPTSADAVAQYVKNMSQFGVLLAVLMAMGAVAQEKDKGTAALVLAKPMPRGVFLWAKFAAFGLTFGLSVFAAGAAAYYYTLLLFEPLDAGAWLALNALVWLFCLVYVALTLSFSAVTRSQASAGGLALGAIILLAGLGALPRIGAWLPGQLIAWGAEVVGGGGEAHWPALWVSVGLIGAALVGGQVLLERQEL